MANIFEFLSKDGNITPEKARKSRQMPFHDKTAYVWMGMLPLKKRVNRDKCSFATKQRMFGVFAIDEILRYRGSRIPGSPTLCHPVCSKLDFLFLKTCKLLTTPCCESLWTWQSREVVEPLCACTTVLFSLEIFQFFVFDHTSTTTATIKTISNMSTMTTITTTCVDHLACTTVGYFFRHFYQNICGVILFGEISSKPFWCWHQKNLLFRLQVFTILCPKEKKLELGVPRCLIMHQPQQQQEKRQCQNSNNNNNMCGPP